MPRPTLPIRLAALLALLGVLLAACGGAATPAAQPTAAGAGATAAPAEQPTAAPATGATAAPAEQATTAPAADAEVSLQETLIHAGDFTDQISMDPAVVYEFGGIQVVGSVYQTLVTIPSGRGRRDQAAAGEGVGHQRRRRYLDADLHAGRES